MPEGHSIHRLALVLGELFAGQIVRASSPQGRFTAGADILDGSLILPAQAWGKHLFVPFVVGGQNAGAGSGRAGEHATQLPDAALDPDLLWLHVHLGLYGRWVFNGDAAFLSSRLLGAPHILIGEEATELRAAAPTAIHVTGPATTRASGPGNHDVEAWRPPAPRGAVRLRLLTEHGSADLSGPNQCAIKTGDEVAAVVGRLGPDPLRNAPGDRERFIELVRARRSPVGALVMNQSVAAGPGNIYRAESLFRAGIHPYRVGARVGVGRLADLWDDLVSLMGDGLTRGTIRTISPELAPAEPLPGDPEASRFAVYHRQGRTCLRCGATVREAEMQGRRLFWCPGCQH
ncbi:Fpg/Nei family DNA glycosylase [Trueperella abortisuis]|uniref:DNA-(apurinic or apyrimidinic site) lyase n=1 Tax=Trueperella abortisuis TaxID=445930 RepID=A0ABT9PKQ1_9ACTO|nr:Fpg/Nei family DNA glycosylase [Trueperella abortisuis]MDP9833302.1 endonuclease-8/formamidopyrimidine-DNA glycosylase [Trueperella abortisuis]